jgi:hypothetical protein
MSGKIYVFIIFIIDVLYNLRNSARFQPPKCLKSHFRDSRFQRTPLDGLAHAEAEQDQHQSVGQPQGHRLVNVRVGEQVVEPAIL